MTARTYAPATDRRGLLVIGLVLASPVWLSAHEGGSAAGLLSGLIHPISGFDHVLAMGTVGGTLKPRKPRPAS